MSGRSLPPDGRCPWKFISVGDPFIRRSDRAKFLLEHMGSYRSGSDASGVHPGPQLWLKGEDGTILKYTTWEEIAVLYLREGLPLSPWFLQLHPELE